MQIVKTHGPSKESGYLVRVDLDDGRAIWLYPRLFGAILALGLIIDADMWYDEEWSYETLDQAVVALIEWLVNLETMQEPNGWIRNKGRKAGMTRRRRDGDPNKEEVTLD